MGRTYSSVVEAITSGSRCSFQLPLPPLALPIPGVPLIPIPKIPDVTAFLPNLFCPLDEAEEPTES